ncbi:hypothetical protein Osc1_18500 [Hominimerdicola sp. 21CYCFAH17_S]
MDASSVADTVSSIVDSSSSADFTEVCSKLDEINATLTSIDSGIKYIVGVGLFIIAVLALWYVLNKFYFDGV